MRGVIALCNGVHSRRKTRRVIIKEKGLLLQSWWFGCIETTPCNAIRSVCVGPGREVVPALYRLISKLEYLPCSSNPTRMGHPV